MVINGLNSNWLPIRAGVPHGSILEPLLFINFINDIVNEINAEIKLFADDTSLYLIVDNPSDTAFLLNQDLNQYNVGLKNGSSNSTRIKLKQCLFPVRETNHITHLTNE